MDLSHERHDNLRKELQKFNDLGDGISDEDFINLMREIRHSSLIIAGSEIDGELKIVYADTEEGSYGVLFTDMDELRKSFPDFEIRGYSFTLERYADLVENSHLKGFFINPQSEFFILPADALRHMGEGPEMEYLPEEGYSSEEIRSIKDSIDNSSLEEFIRDPKNTARYEELFEMISKSTILTLRLSDIDVECLADDGMITMKKIGPIGFLHSDKTGGKYATAFTSDEKIKNITTDYNKYSQIVNFSQMTNYVLNDDMDGIIINPEDERIMLTREVLLEFSPLLEKTCNDSGLNSAIFYMFLMEE